MKDSNGTKSNLIKLICSHSLWTKSEIWDKVIESLISDEVASHELYGLNHKAEDRKKLLGNIVFCQLGVIAETMNSFLVSPGLTSELIQKYGHKYELADNDLEVLMNTFRGKKEKEVARVLTVQRGIPAWLQELEGTAAAITKRNPKSLAELITQDRNST